MGNVKGIFNFLKSSRSESFSIEDQRQRDYANAQLKSKKENVVSDTNREDVEGDIPKEIQAYGKEMLQDIVTKIGFEASVNITKTRQNTLFFEIISSEDVSRLIGRDGMTLEALQLLLHAMVYKKCQNHYKIVIDVGGYRDKKEDALKAVVQKAINSKKPKVRLTPMRAYERRLVHMMVASNDSVKSYSEGEGTERHVVLELLSSENVSE